ncbi:MAG: 30S ribosomal protein S15 [Phycisphaeraceae bacterium]|nr:30S ribosomal protein S15 [Phycisphaerales bacterium]MCB9861182.1 30S ribosomal protein S15 [Phycisphaeraceae bacterium]
MSISVEVRKQTIVDSRRHDTDSGSPEVQISLLTARINELSEHLQSHKKDNHSRRGLIGMVNKRNSLLRYLARTRPEEYKATIARLGLRR